MPGKHGHIDMELRCSALLPLTEMFEAFEAAMDLIGEGHPAAKKGGGDPDYEPAKAEIARHWNEAAEDLSQHFSLASRGMPSPGDAARHGGAYPPMPLDMRPTRLRRAAMEIPPYLAVEWAQRVNDCLAETSAQEALGAALEATAAYRVAQMAFVGGAPDRYVREFLRRAVAELTAIDN